VTFDRDKDDRVALATKIAGKTGATIVAPFDDPFVMAGQGTAGLEAIAQASSRGTSVDVALAPASGGGLVGGLSTAFGEESPKTEVYAVEPEGFDDLSRSLKSGKIEKNSRTSGSVCDALLVNAPSPLTFGVNKRRLAGALTVSDDEALRAVRFAFDFLRLVVEPSGAVGLAAILSGKVPMKDRTAAVVLSGGNIDRDVLSRALETV
jgi:threonine dehydratase